MGPVRVVMIDVVDDKLVELATVPDDGAVEELASQGADPAFGERVRHGVGAGNCVVAGQAAFRYSLMSPSQRYTRTQHRPASRQVNDHGRVSGTHTPR